MVVDARPVQAVRIGDAAALDVPHHDEAGLDGLDEGAIILQKEVPIGPDDTLGQVYFNHLFPLGIAALLEAADLVAAGKHQEMVQDESQANYEGWFDQAAARIHWSNHVSQIYNLIRACNPAPGAWTALNGEKVQIYDVRKHITPTFGSVKGKPGEIVECNHILRVDLQSRFVRTFRLGIILFQRVKLGFEQCQYQRIGFLVHRLT